MTLFSKLKAGERVSIKNMDSEQLDLEWKNGRLSIYELGDTKPAMQYAKTKDELYNWLAAFKVVEVTENRPAKKIEAPPKRKKK